MFGDNVPQERADSAKEAARNCDALLVVGSALMTMSAFRLAKWQGITSPENIIQLFPCINRELIMFVDNSSFSTKSFKSDYVLSDFFYGNIRLMINPNPRLAHEANAPIAAINIGERGLTVFYR